MTIAGRQIPLFPDLTDPLISLRAAIRARSARVPDPMERANIPTSPDTSSPWSEDSGPGGWSAKMFVHRMMSISTPQWGSSDTESLLSGVTPLRARVNNGSGISLSDVIKVPGRASSDSFCTSRALRGLLRRSVARGKSLRVLLRAGSDTIPAIVIFSKMAKTGSVSWTVTSAVPLPDSLRVGLQDVLRRHAPCSPGTR